MRCNQIECMPNIGDKCKGHDLGKSSKSIYVWTTCPVCKEQRWVASSSLKKSKGRCHPCYTRINSPKRKGRPTGLVGELSKTWKGGRIIDPDGYIKVLLRPDDFFFPLANSAGYAYEHRLVMAKHLNRCLLSWEVVHHRNGIKDDNRLENLQLLPNKIIHIPSTRLQARMKALEDKVANLESRILLLEAENILLQSQVSVVKEEV